MKYDKAKIHEEMVQLGLRQFEWEKPQATAVVSMRPCAPADQVCESKADPVMPPKAAPHTANCTVTEDYKNLLCRIAYDYAPSDRTELEKFFVDRGWVICTSFSPQQAKPCDEPVFIEGSGNIVLRGVSFDHPNCCTSINWHLVKPHKRHHASLKSAHLPDNFDIAIAHCDAPDVECLDVPPTPINSESTSFTNLTGHLIQCGDTVDSQGTQWHNVCEDITPQQKEGK